MTAPSRVHVFQTFLWVYQKRRDDHSPPNQKRTKEGEKAIHSENASFIMINLNWMWKALINGEGPKVSSRGWRKIAFYLVLSQQLSESVFLIYRAGPNRAGIWSVVQIVNCPWTRAHWNVGWWAPTNLFNLEWVLWWQLQNLKLLVWLWKGNPCSHLSTNRKV